MKQSKSLVILVIILLPTLIFGRADGKAIREQRIAEACQLDGADIRIDGRLNDYIWEKAPRYGDFIQQRPEDGAAPSQNTEFAVCYDSEYLYVAVRAFDDEPSQITGILTRRDESSPSDWVYISIDSYHDNRTAFEFGLNAAGVKQDLRRFDDTNADFDWEAVWDGAVNIDPDGWSAEFAIPFRELRFNTGEELTWGLNVYREIPRNDNEIAFWNYWSNEQSGFVSNYGDLAGISGLDAHQPLYISPYILGQTGANDVVINKANAYESLSNVGADIRKNFKNGLTFSGTINPDFGQVEADPAEFNLTEFETYFREKRPFFMEGGNILNFSLGFGDGDMSSNSLFYSRRIGRSPQGWAVYQQDDVVTVDQRDNARILAAGKFTGKLENGLSLGTMFASTAEEKARIRYGDGTTSENIIEPATSYFLTRLQQDFRNGETTVGGIFTATNRDLPDDDPSAADGGWNDEHSSLRYLRKNAYTGGLDIFHSFNDRKYEIHSALAFSRVEGGKDAMLATQMHPSRYFQRTDADHLSVNEDAKSLSGWAGKLIAGKTGGRLMGFGGILATSPGFEINDLGFLRSVDNINQFTWVGYRYRDAGKFFLNYGLNFNQWANWTFGGERKNVGGNINGHFTLLNNWRVGGGLNRNIGGITPYHLRGGPAMQGPDNFNVWYYINSDYRKKFNARLQGHYFTNDDNVQSIGLSPRIGWRPRKNISLSLGPNMNFFDDTWAWVTTMSDSLDGLHYIFSSLKQAQTSITFRADVTLSTTLSLQYYTQAFLTSGEYFDYKEVADNTAKEFDQRFSTIPDALVELDSYGALGGVDFDQDGTLDYTPSSYVYSDFNYKQLTSNLVLRWEYSTGSVMYLVWSRGASASNNVWNFDLEENLSEMFDLDADNIFLIKVNRLLNI